MAAPAAVRPEAIAGRVGAMLSAAVVVAILALAVGVTVVPAVVGGHTLTVLSGSMAPRLPVGSVVVDKPADPATLRVDDIITYELGDDLITHRIVAIKQTADGPLFTTQGDANEIADTKPVAASQIRGRLWYVVPYIGTVRGFLLSRAGLIAGSAAVLLIGAIWLLARVNRPGTDPDERAES